MKDTSEGSLKLVNSETGYDWMNVDLFTKVIDHLIKFSHATLDNPIVFVMDNHVSHCGYEVLNKAMSSLFHHTPPKNVFGPMTKFFNTTANSWQEMNPGQPTTLYQMTASWPQLTPRLQC